MNRRLLKSLQYLIGILFISFSYAFPALAETDPNPNSPTPVLLSAPDSTRALAVKKTGKSLYGKLPSAQNNSFDSDSEVVLYVTNIELMNGENANAFRVYAEDASGRLYRFPVLRFEIN